MENIDELAKQYPEFKTLILDSRSKLREADKIIAQIYPDKDRPTLDYKPPGASKDRPFGTQQRQVRIQENFKASVLKEFQDKVTESVAHKSVEEQEKVIADLQTIVTSKKLLAVEKKDIDQSQELSIDEINRFKNSERIELKSFIHGSRSVERPKDKDDHKKSKDIDLDVE